MKKNKGFTLIEVVISIAIISIVGLSVMQMFTTSSKVNRKAKEIDEANLKATSIIEKIKNNPENYAKNMKLNKEKFLDKGGYVVTDEKKAKTSESEYEKVIYYDYQWNEVGDVKKAKFKSTVKLNKKGNYGEHSDFNPRKYDTTGYDDPVIDGTTDQYLIIALNEPEYFKGDKPYTTYEMYIFKDFTSESFLKFLYDEKNGYRGIYIRDRMSKGKTYKEATDEFDAICSLGEDIVIFYAVRAMQTQGKSSFENPDAKEKAVDSIPFYVKFENLDKNQNIEVYNISNKNIDIYILSDYKEQVEKNINFVSKKGVFGKTYLNESRKDESNFDVEVKVTSIDNDRNLAKLEMKKYRAN